MKHLTIGVTILACSTLFAADFRPLNVKTGQWQTTMTGQTTGQPPIPEEALKRLTPEQRAKMEAAMAARGGRGPRTTVTKSCVTKETLDKPFNTGDEATRSCTRTLVTSSGNKQEIKMECKGQINGNGTVTVEALDPENVKGSIQMTVGGGEHTMNVNYTFTSKWLAATCPDSK